mmetsp:Transcript_16766/g.42957  ORF Transcript_16766/g.42957 Transcript_16766/m.42957 type:complete len:344 (-) Transcript_16766:1258-2289(-)
MQWPKKHSRSWTTASTFISTRPDTYALPRLDGSLDVTLMALAEKSPGDADSSPVMTSTATCMSSTPSVMSAWTWPSDSTSQGNCRSMSTSPSIVTPGRIMRSTFSLSGKDGAPLPTSSSRSPLSYSSWPPLLTRRSVCSQWKAKPTSSLSSASRLVHSSIFRRWMPSDSPRRTAPCPTLNMSSAAIWMRPMSTVCMGNMCGNCGPTPSPSSCSSLREAAVDTVACSMASTASLISSRQGGVSGASSPSRARRRFPSSPLMPFTTLSTKRLPSLAALLSPFTASRRKPSSSSSSSRSASATWSIRGMITSLKTSERNCAILPVSNSMDLIWKHVWRLLRVVETK